METKHLPKNNTIASHNEYSYIFQFETIYCMLYPTLSFSLLDTIQSNKLLNQYKMH